MTGTEKQKGFSLLSRLKGKKMQLKMVAHCKLSFTAAKLVIVAQALKI